MRMAKAVALQVEGQVVKTKYQGETLEEVSLRGVSANMAEMDTHEAERGRYIVEPDESHRANVAMIGSDIAKRLFKSADPLGKTLYVDGEAFEVVAIGKELGSPFSPPPNPYSMF